MSSVLSLLMVLCLACQVNIPQSCGNCGSAVGVSSDTVSDDQFEILPAATAGPTLTSPTIARQGPNLVLTAFAVQPGTATVTVLEAPRGGQLMAVTDSNATRNLGSTSRWMIKGVMARVAVQVTVASGAWAIWGAWVRQPSDRGNYYDRNPTPQLVTYNGTDSPGGPTVRGTYTVPIGRRAYVESVFATVIRSSVATSASLSQAWFTYTPSGGTSRIMLITQIGTNNIGDKDAAGFGLQGFLQPGDRVQGLTNDSSTGGTTDHYLAMKATEYDA